MANRKNSATDSSSKGHPSIDDQCPGPRQHRHNSTGKIIEWVNRLERINSSTETTAAHRIHAAAPGNLSGALATIASATSATATSTIVSIGGAGQKQHLQLVKANENQNEDDDHDLCFKAAQLITELLLMMFAASLLVIATIVIVSRRVPAFMDSYEVVPKFLFFLCVFVASYSFARWLSIKVYRQYRACLSSEAIEEEGEEIADGENKDGQGGDKQKCSNSLDTRQQFADDLKDQHEPLLVAEKNEINNSNNNNNKVASPTSSRLFRSKTTRSMTSQAPPVRQVAFDSSASSSPVVSNFARDDTIVEECEAFITPAKSID